MPRHYQSTARPSSSDAICGICQHSFKIRTLKPGKKPVAFKCANCRNPVHRKCAKSLISATSAGSSIKCPYDNTVIATKPVPRHSRRQHQSSTEPGRASSQPPANYRRMSRAERAYAQAAAQQDAALLGAHPPSWAR
ncbi:hypothetical protein [Agarilytica rhodophyticola]|uniref:hypothetical protein n=1 Tax=Agarilytica rhodophyticola TaxID=1737490 RepID=UPI000B3435E8|nr:hypothetical protein [Agarilytica rhodophyticola]